jgi:hypothetical protein
MLPPRLSPQELRRCDLPPNNEEICTEAHEDHEEVEKSGKVAEYNNTFIYYID